MELTAESLKDLSLENHVSLKRNEETCYSGYVNHENGDICFPSTSTGEVLIKNRNGCKVIKLGDNVKPDIAIYVSKIGWVIGCRDTQEVTVIDSEYKTKPLFIAEKAFYATAFKISSAEQLYIGNLYGNPYIFEHGKAIELTIDTKRSYDALWINEEILLISCTSENRIVKLRKKGSSWETIKSYAIDQPYRFSPLVNDVALVTTRGWTDREGEIYAFRASELEAELDLKEHKTFKQICLSYITVPDKYFWLKKNAPLFILRILGMQRYTGYINDCAWVSKDEFLVTTKQGGAIVHMNIAGETLSILYLGRNSIPTRFISNRYPSKEHIFVNAGKSEIQKVLLFNPLH